MDYDRLIQKTGSNKNLRILNMESEKVEFLYVRNKSLVEKIELNLGAEIILEKFFKNNIPSEAEVEYAINFIEDELMSRKELVNSQEELYISRQQINEMTDLMSDSIKRISRQEVEEIFTKYALVSMGRSPVYDDVKMNKEKYAKLLVLREIVHHLNFENVNFFE